MSKQTNKFLFFMMFGVLTLNAQNRLFVNQAGYLVNGIKTVVSSEDADSFYVVDYYSDAVKFAGSFTNSFENDNLSGMSLVVGDFSDFTQSGKYFIKLGNGYLSLPFEISDSVFNSLYILSQKAFYFQRCGTSLLMQNAGQYHHLACHTQDGFYHQTTGMNGFKYAVGGWHDAGDFGKYIVNAGITLGTLMLGYELFPEYFSKDDLNIPESGNGIPDLLDEIRYELEWELKMQDESGGVFTKLTRLNFAPFEMPEEDNATRYLYRISSTATGDFAAVMAHAYRLFGEYDSAFAETCLSASLNAWNFLEQNPDIVPAGGFVNPEDTNTGEYGDNNDSDERLWAAAELYSSTNDTAFEDYYLSKFHSVGLFSSVSWQWVAPMAHLIYLLTTTSRNSVAEAELKNSLNNYVLQIISKMNSNPFSIPLSDGEFYWGSNGAVLNEAMFLIAEDIINDNNENFNYVIKCLNYISGENPINQSFVSGVGTNRLMHPHHRQSASDNIDEPIPGLLSGGPNQYLNDPTLQALFNSETPPALCYIDSVSSYASNEIAINWNAPLVFVSGFVNGKAMLTSVNDFGYKAPNQIRLFQNYPNPFNPDTVIKFEIVKKGNVRLEVYNVLGEKVATLLNKKLNAGLHRIKFIPQNYRISSGIYFYTLTVGENRLSNKMVYIK